MTLAGAGLSGTDFLPQITSYDYTAPLSEQGRTGQPGTGGPNKYKVQYIQNFHFQIPVLRGSVSSIA